MKRIFALALAVVMIGALLCACGDKSEGTSASTVTTTVSSKYDDGYATTYASSTSKDENGDTVYEFTGDQYEEFKRSHKNVLAGDLQSDIAEDHDASYGEYAYFNDEKKAVMIGIHEGQYDEKIAETEAAAAAEYGFKYFQNLETPVDTIKVIYCDANDQETVYATFEFTAE